MVVYVLKDPNSQLIRYVGVSKYTALQRYKQHIKDAKTRQRKGIYLSAKDKWMLGLASNGLIPLIETWYDNLTEEEALLKEKELIYKFKRVSEGGVLYNVQEGGNYDCCKATVWNKGIAKCYSDEFIDTDRLHQPNRKTVYRFDKKGIFMDKWTSVRFMCDILSLDRRTVMRCLKNEVNFISHKGFMFSYNNIAPKYENKSTLKTYGKSPHAKRILAIKGYIKYQFDSIKEAGDKLGILPVNISSVLIGKQKTSHGFTFKYL